MKKDIKTPEQNADEVEKVTAQDIQIIAQTIFKDASLNFALIGRFKDETALKTVLTFK